MMPPLPTPDEFAALLTAAAEHDAHLQARVAALEVQLAECVRHVRALEAAAHQE